MEYLKDDKMLKFNPDTLEAVRKELNLEKPGRIGEAVDILENWVQMQSHFVKKDFSRDYLERTLVTAKGMVERAKEKLDKLCTFKTLMPEFFTVTDVKKDLEPLMEIMVYFRDGPIVTKSGSDDGILEKSRELFKYYGHIDSYLGIFYSNSCICPRKAPSGEVELMVKYQKNSSKINVQASGKAIFCKRHTAHLPQMTPQHHRVLMVKLVSENLESSTIFNFYKYLTMLSEYFMQVEYCSGFHIVLDYTEINILAFVTKINPMELRQIITLMTEGYGCRIKGIHVISSSKMVDTLITLLKQVFSAKLADRIHLHKSHETLSEYIPNETLPTEYGGKEKPLLEINKAWLKAISSKEFLDYMNEMNNANTNESCRQSDKFNEHYVGMPGSFRALSVD